MPLIETDGLLLDEMQERYLEDVRSIYNHYVRTSTATFHVAEIGPDAMRALVFHEDPRCRTFAILDGPGGRVAGYAGISRYSPREAYDGTAVVHVYLAPDATGRGTGSRALRFLESYARKRGFHALLALVTEENERSASLFLSLGYDACGTLREVGRKFGRLLGVTLFEKILPDGEDMT